ncbi:ribonuclease J1 [Fundicoccus ignavus]|uniref:Ribonuclease J n=1 Tax=Fundicoccus ignavus TaxID=2664442 RepID=A0A6I2GXR8_9LACT|nr:ribonuclease J [Fundicoccus ignavus]MRI81857.1 RNase J family beta-CASP ribonuclease [Fundicoccus ignavus]MRI85173.1 RNase J family beta-CASP ribonuclease [Fundicoccus ignavus]MRJ48174.1 RNase J family beta-CASP ribonuclease [Fundicoccus ignavus]
MSVNLKNNEAGVFAVGGLNEIGKNMYGVQFQDEIIILDSGVMFPEDDLLGIDYVIPDYQYILQNRHKVKALIISHGHEDHIGGIPFLLQQINVPIYAGKLASALIRNKLHERGLLRDANITEIDENTVIRFRKTSVSFYRTTHSIPEAYGVVVKTPPGNIVFTGDYKFDFTPVGEPADLHRMARIGEEGVLALLSDSTNSEIPTFTKSEQIVGQSIKNIIQRVSGRVIFATFASNVSRLQQVIQTAKETGRKVAVFGRSMESAIKTGRELGYIQDENNDVIIDNRDINNHPAEQMIILCTGSQGEPMAALSRIAAGSHRQIHLQPEDTVIFSSSPIPGNTISVNRVINQLSEAGANVIHGKFNNIHTSGHGGQQEQLLMLRLMKPKYFIPVHGEYRMLSIHAGLAQRTGIAKENCYVMENGQMLALTADSARLAGRFPANDVYVDGSGIGDIGSIVLRDRKSLSEDGLVIVTATIDYQNKQLVSGPDIMSRGFIYMRESGDLIHDLQNNLRSIINRGLNENGNNVTERMIRDLIFEQIHPLIYEKTERSPMILPVLLDINKGVRKRTAKVEQED